MLWVGEGRRDSESEGWQSETKARKEGREMGHSRWYGLRLSVKGKER